MTQRSVLTRQPTLRQDDRGQAVRALQDALRGHGHDPGQTDGHFGARTLAAVKAFQKATQLPADGVVGPRTWAALSPPDDQDLQGVRSLSEQGAAFIAGFEGFRAHLYIDAAGHATIGYGHLVHRGPVSGQEPAEFKAGISRDRALQLLTQDAATAAGEVHRSVTRPLTQRQFDALVSFVFNCGGGNFRTSTLLTKLNAGDLNAVPLELRRWTKAGGRELAGLVTRRAAEAELFAHGRYHT